MMKLLRRAVVVLLALALAPATLAQTKWYKFEKKFVETHYAADSAFGSLAVTKSNPAGSVHSVRCGGDDGELHIGIAESAVQKGFSSSLPISAPGGTQTGTFGIVVEPPNVDSGMASLVKGLKNQKISYLGYFRVWNEGHDVGPVHPSNPHHVFEMHPAWAVRTATKTVGSPAAVFPMPKYSGYGTSKFRPLLQGLAQGEWLRAAEDNNSLFVQLKKAENFYQLPVKVKSVHAIAKGKEAVVDVFSSATWKKPVYENLTVIAVDGSPAANLLVPDKKTFLLGFFSVNLRKAMAAAAGHQGTSASVSARQTLEFFAFGIPAQKAVSSCPSH